MNQNLPPYRATDADKQLLAAIQGGLPLDPHPYATIGRSIGMSEDEVISRIQTLQQHQIIRRMGIIVHHRPLGYQANAMVVWNLSDPEIEAFGNQVSQLDFVTLCYQRRPEQPRWPYTLYTMIHGKDRESVLERVEVLRGYAPRAEVDYRVLFSSRRFKQQGARYFNKKKASTPHNRTPFSERHPAPQHSGNRE